MSMKQRKARRPRSVVWYYFDKIPDDPFKAKCKICGSLCQHGTNTSNLFYHLRHKHPASYREAEMQKEQEVKLYMELKAKSGKFINSAIVRGRGRSRGRPPNSPSKATDGLAVIKTENDESTGDYTFSPQTLSLSASGIPAGRKPYGSGVGKVKREVVDVKSAILHWLSADLLHPSTITRKGFKVFLTACGFWPAELPSKKSLMETHIPKLVEETRVKLRQELSTTAAPSVSLSVENWSYRNTQLFLTLTAHFINNNWAMTSYVLETFECTDERTETNIASNLKRVTDEWDLTQSITVVSSDISDEALSSALALNGWEELSCFGRALNNVVDTALESVPEFVRVHKKMSEAVIYFYRCTKAADALAAVQQQHGLSTDRIKQEHSELWTSTFAAMERVVQQYEAVNTVLCFLGKDHMCLCDDEVELIKDVVQVLKPFQAAVEELCTEPYTCVSKLIPIASLLQQVTAATASTCGQEVSTSDTQVKLKDSLLAQMQQHLSGLESKPVLATATLLDPRFKQHAFTDTEALEAAQERLLILTQEVVKAAEPQDVPATSTPSETATTLWGIFDRKVVDAKALKTDVSEADNETRRFFSEVNILRTENPLQWWKLNEVQFPHLKVLAKKYLCVPATAFHSDRLFYKEGNEFATRRDRFRPTYLNNMLFLNQNLI